MSERPEGVARFTSPGVRQPMRVAVMIEAQEALRWEQWKEIVAWTEDLGFESLWLSDHLMPLGGGAPADPIDPFLALSCAAARTSRVRLGTLVSPVTFRHPAITARLAAGLAHLSGGRFTLGLGAGWFEPEHRAFEIALPSPRRRLALLDEAAGTIRTLLGVGPAAVTPTGARLRCAHSVPVLIGGAGERRTMSVVARHADEWNVPGISVDLYRQKVRALWKHCEAAERSPAEISRSMVFTHAVAPSQEAANKLAAKMMADVPRAYRPGFRADSPVWLIGSPDDVIEQILAYANEGVDRIMMQWRTPPTRAELELVASEIMPHVSARSVAPAAECRRRP